MKKTISTVLLGLCLAIPAWAGTRGDADGNGIVDVSDIATLVGNLLSGTTSRSDADANCDGIVDVSDVATLVDYLLKGEWPGGVEPEDETFTVNGVTFKMIAVKGGTFTMGATSDQAAGNFPNENPAHQVRLSSYCIGQTEVTQQLWKAVMGNNPSRFTENVQCPVEQVSWNDCHAFITKLNQLTGRNFRMPTEAEWEFAARGGNLSKGYTYSGSNNCSDVAWFSDNSNWKTHAVATKAPNELGIYDMSGNVVEWCNDWSYNYTSAPQVNPQGPATGTARMYRNGSWAEDARSCRIARREYNDPDIANSLVGMRLAL